MKIKKEFNCCMMASFDKNRQMNSIPIALSKA